MEQEDLKTVVECLERMLVVARKYINEGETIISYPSGPVMDELEGLVHSGLSSMIAPNGEEAKEEAKDEVKDEAKDEEEEDEEEDDDDDDELSARLENTSINELPSTPVRGENKEKKPLTAEKKKDLEFIHTRNFKDVNETNFLTICIVCGFNHKKKFGAGKTPCLNCENRKTINQLRKMIAKNLK
jgi:hypothetical protein